MKKLIAFLLLLPAFSFAQYYGPIYKPSSVAITGGAINGTTLGTTTPAAATVTTLTLSNGGLIFTPDATYNLGAAGATRPANLYVASSINGATGVFSGSVTSASHSFTGGGITWVDDNTYNIGAVGANRPANIYAGSNGFFGGNVQVGGAALTVPSGGVGISKITADGLAAGAGGAKLQLVCGTLAGTAKLVISAGTLATALTIIDNIGAGVTGC